jgi:1,2-dihydroxy-3-keto-5-methylthiopentene dioxygenase
MSEEAKPVENTATTKTKNDEGELPEAKKQKTETVDSTTTTESKADMTTETKKGTTPESPDSEWPEAWFMMEDGTFEDQKERNRLSPNKPASVEVLRELGICYWKMDAENYSYPAKAIPWDPKDAADPKLMAIRDDRGYSYADIISVRPDMLPGYDEKIKAFFEEHIHDAEEIRYIIDGSGYFDIRDKEDKWIRIWIKKGDLMTLPEGCYHRFTCDETDFIQAMRLFIGQPVWTPFNRPQEEHVSRKFYVDNFMMEEEKKD